MGKPWATELLGDYCISGNKHVKNDCKKAMTLYRQAAEIGGPHYITRLGMEYFLGRVVPKSVSTCFQLFKTAAEQADADGQ